MKKRVRKHKEASGIAKSKGFSEDDLSRIRFLIAALLVLSVGFYMLKDFSGISVGKAYSVMFEGQEFAESVEINLLANVPEIIELTVDNAVKTAQLEFTGAESELIMDIDGIMVSSTRRASDEGVNVDTFDATAQINSYCLEYPCTVPIYVTLKTDGRILLSKIAIQSKEITREDVTIKDRPMLKEKISFLKTAKKFEEKEAEFWEVGAPNNAFELSENLKTGSNMETIEGIVSELTNGYLSDSELPTLLAPGTASNAKGTFPYDQKLFFEDADSEYVLVTENNDDEISDFLYFKSGSQIARYLLEFTSPLESGIYDSLGNPTPSGNYLSDFENIEIEMLGKKYTILEATRNDGKNSQIRLVLENNGEKIDMEDANVNDEESSSDLIVDNELITGAKVIIEGTDDDISFKISKISVNMLADDDLYVPPGSTLGENPELKKPQVLFTQNWDIGYEGVASEGSSEGIGIGTSGESKYQLLFSDGNKKPINLPLIESISPSQIVLGDKDGDLINKEGKKISKNDYLLLTNEEKENGRRDSFAIIYKGADKLTSDEPLLKLQDLGSGKLNEVSINSNKITTIVVGGEELTVAELANIEGFQFYNASSTNSNDFDIFVDLNANGKIEENIVQLNTYFGASIEILQENDNLATITITTPHQDDYGTLKPSPFIFGLSADSESSVQIDKSENMAHKFFTFDEGTIFEIAYDSHGTIVGIFAEKDDEPKQLIVEYPESQLLPQVFVMEADLGEPGSECETSLDCPVYNKCENNVCVGFCEGKGQGKGDKEGNLATIQKVKGAQASGSKPTHIIEFKEKPLIAVKSDAEREFRIKNAESQNIPKNVREKIEDRLNRHEQLLEKAKENAIAEMLNVNPALKSRITSTYKNVFNGVAAKLSEEEASRIKLLPSVKNVYRNEEVHAVLEESVNQIEADEVWKTFDAEGMPVTGEGITIGIIDTGVDYTHPDLGGCFGDEEDESKKEDKSKPDDDKKTAKQSGAPCLAFNEIFNKEDKDALSLSNKIISAASGSLCPESKESFDKELKNLLKLRKELLAEDIENNPYEALLVNELPQSILLKLTNNEKEQLIEERGVFKGKLEVLHVDDFDNPENSRFIFSLISKGEKTALFAADELPVFASGTEVEVKGLEIDKKMAVDFSGGKPFNVLSVPEGSPASENFGEQKVLAIVANIGDEKAPTTVDEAKRMLFGTEENTVQDFYKKNSFGKASLTGDVFGPYDLSAEKACYTSGMLTEALASAEEDIVKLGKTFSDYDRLILAVPCTPCVCYGGLGTIGKSEYISPNDDKLNISISWDFYFDLGVVGHELGHNFGVHHANFYSCLDANENPVSYSYDCETAEYADPYSIMGVSRGHHNAPHKREIGWLDDSNIKTATEGTYSLKPIEIITSAEDIQLIKVPITRDTSHYFALDNLYYTIEFRQPIDYDKGFELSEGPEVYDGVTIRVAKFNDEGEFTFIQTSLLDLKVSPDKSWFDKHFLEVGQSFTEGINGYKITLESISGEGADAVAQVKIEQIPKVELEFGNNLVHYDFDEKLIDGQRLKDKAGYVLGGMVHGATNRAGGIFFQGDGGYELPKEKQQFVEMGAFTNTFIKENNAFTFSAWLNLKQYPEFSGIVYDVGYGHIDLRVTDSGEIGLSAYFDIGTDWPERASIISDTKLKLRKWYHVAAVFDGTALILYIDGVEAGRIDSLEENGKKHKTENLFMQYATNNHIGGDTYGSGINGIIDEFKVYARALNSEEILGLKESFIPVEDSDANQKCKVIGGYDFVNEDDNPMDDFGHGTHVAATAAGNGILKGVAPDAKIVSYKVLDSGGGGSWDNVIAAIERSVDPNQDGDFSDHLDIISISLGGLGHPDDPLSTAVDNAVDAGVVAVVAAGNSGPDGNADCRNGDDGSFNSICSPGTARKAITVGAADKCDIMAGFSSRGPVSWEGEILLKPDVVAPGVSICAAQSSEDEIWGFMWNNYGVDVHCIDYQHITMDHHIKIEGTSMATPHVSGAVALLMQAHPEWSPETIKSAIMSTSSELSLNPISQGAGRIDVLNAVDAKISTAPQSISFQYYVNEQAHKESIRVANLKEEQIILSINLLELKDEAGQDYEFAILNATELVIDGNSYTDFSLIVDAPAGLEGIFTGKIALKHQDKGYVIPFVFERSGNILNNDVGIFNLETSEPKVGEPISVSAVVKNLGLNQANDILVRFKVDNKILEEKIIPLIESKKSISIEFEWKPIRENSYTLELEAIAENDEDKSNNILEEEIEINYIAPDINGYVREAKGIIIDTEADMPFSIYNSGEEKAEGLEANLYAFYKPEVAFFYFQNEEEPTEETPSEEPSKEEIVEEPKSAEQESGGGEGKPSEPKKSYTSVNYNGTEYRLTAIFDGLGISLNVSTDNFNETLNFTINDKLKRLHGDIYVFSEFFTDSFAEFQIGNASLTKKELDDLDSYEQREESIKWAPKLMGGHHLLFFINSSLDSNFEDNYFSRSVKVLREGINIGANFIIDYSKTFVVGDEANITTSISNLGTEEAKNIRITLFEEDAKTESEESEIIPEIKKKEIGSKKLDSLQPQKSEEVKFEWTPAKPGYHYLLLIAEAKKDINPEDNDELAFVDVVPKGSDLVPIFHYTGEDIFINEKAKIEGELFNRGQSDSTNTFASLYEVKLKGKNEGARKLIEKKSIGIVGANNFAGLEFSWTPTSSGDFLLELIAEADNDEDSSNNAESRFVTALVKAYDIKPAIMFYPKYIMANKQAYVGVEVKNFGSEDAPEFNLTLFANDNYADSIVFEDLERKADLFVYFSWTPQNEGIYNLKVNTSLADADSSNNADSSEVKVFKSKDVEIRIVDKDGSFIERTLVLADEAILFKGSATFTLPDIELDMWIAKEGEPILASIYSNSTISNMTITSSYINEPVMQNGLLLYDIFANNDSWNYDSFQGILQSRLETLNIRYTEIQAFLCDGYNFSSDKCENWQDIPSEVNVDSGEMLLAIDANHATAFAIGDKDYDNDNAPDWDDKDSDNDGIDDEQDTFTCFNGRLKSREAFNVTVNESEDVGKDFKGKNNISIKDKEKKIVEFNIDLDKDKLDCREVTVEKQPEVTTRGFTLIKGISLTDENKTAYVDKIAAFNRVCIKDEEVDSIDELSQNCDGSNEFLVRCDGIKHGNYTCTDVSSQYKVEGLMHSAVAEPSSCSESWSCTEWSSCKDKKQKRTCTETNQCGTNFNKPSEQRSCDEDKGEEEEDKGLSGSLSRNTFDLGEIKAWSDGKSRTLKLGEHDLVIFTFDKKLRSVELEQIKGTRISIKPSWSGKSIDLTAGEAKTFDIDNDNKEDIKFSFETISRDKATVVIERTIEDARVTPPTRVQPQPTGKEDDLRKGLEKTETPSIAAEAKDKGSIATVIFLVSFFAILSVLIGAIIYKRDEIMEFISEKTGKETKPLSEYDKVKSYILNELSRGFTIEQIREKLEEVGWQKELIELVMRDIKKNR